MNPCVNPRIQMYEFMRESMRESMRVNPCNRADVHISISQERTAVQIQLTIFPYLKTTQTHLDTVRVHTLFPKSVVLSTQRLIVFSHIHSALYNGSAETEHTAQFMRRIRHTLMRKMPTWSVAVWQAVVRLPVWWRRVTPPSPPPPSSKQPAGACPWTETRFGNGAEG